MNSFRDLNQKSNVKQSTVQWNESSYQSIVARYTVPAGPDQTEAGYCYHFSIFRCLEVSTGLLLRFSVMKM